MTRTIRNPILATLVALAMLAVGCGANGAAFDDIAGNSEGASMSPRNYDSVQGLADVIAAGGMQENARVVLGEITAVEQGIGAKWSDSGERTVLPWGDPESWGNTAHLTVNVTETLTGPRVGQEITVGLFFGPQTTFDEIKVDFGSLGRVVIFLNEAKVFDYQPDIYTVLEDGQIFGFVDDKNTVDFPLLDGLATVDPGTKSDERLALEGNRLHLDELRRNIASEELSD